MGDRLKTDIEYGERVSLEPGREFVEGHNFFGLDKNDTEVTALQKIINGFINTNNRDTIVSFMEHKLDFAVSFLDTLFLILTEKKDEMNCEFDQIEKELSDIAHKMTKSVYTGALLSSEEKIKTYDLQEELLCYRRSVKDAIAILNITTDNIEKSRNFILGMNNRRYSAKSDRFKDNKDFSFNSKSMTGMLVPTEPSKTSVSTEAQPSRLLSKRNISGVSVQNKRLSKPNTPNK